MISCKICDGRSNSCNNGGGGQHCFANTDSNLEAFSRNPMDDSFAVLAFQLAAFTKYLTELVLTSITVAVSGS